MRRQRFARKENVRPSRRLFIIATEGAKTESIYFDEFSNMYTNVQVKCLGRGTHKSAPKHVLERIQKKIAAKELEKGDEAWLLVDKDEWTESALKRLHNWSEQQENYGLAVSNPMFEYWLLLHFEDGNAVTSKKACMARLKKHLPHYDKTQYDPAPLKKGIPSAVKRAQKRDKLENAPWPKNTGTTVYKLVERLIAAGEPTS